MYTNGTKTIAFPEGGAKYDLNLTKVFINTNNIKWHHLGGDEEWVKILFVGEFVRRENEGGREGERERGSDWP